jgi:hypothetical protein
MRSITRYLSRRLKLKVNEMKSAVARPWQRKLLGFSISNRDRRRISEGSIKRFKGRVGEMTGRMHGSSWNFEGTGLLGTKASTLLPMEAMGTARLSCTDGAWSEPGFVLEHVKVRTWPLGRLSRSPALSFALPTLCFEELGIPKWFAV